MEGKFCIGIFLVLLKLWIFWFFFVIKRVYFNKVVDIEFNFLYVRVYVFYLLVKVGGVYNVYNIGYRLGNFKRKKLVK